jgi:hypothetical protein
MPANRLAGVGIDLQSREVAAGDVDTDPVTSLEQV